MSLLDQLAVPSDSIWLPGKGLVPAHVRQAQKAVEEYDEDLTIGQRGEDWVVLHKRGPDGQPYPVFGLGPELPPADRIKEMLARADTKRRGAQIVADVTRANLAQQEAVRKRASEKTEVAAEAFAWAHRKMGTHPSPRIFVP